MSTFVSSSLSRWYNIFVKHNMIVQKKRLKINWQLGDDFDNKIITNRNNSAISVTFERNRRRVPIELLHVL